MPEELRLLVCAPAPLQQRLRKLCQEAGFTAITTVSPEHLHTALQRAYDVVVVGLLPELPPPSLELPSALPIVVACPEELAEKLPELFPTLVPAGILVEPITAGQLRAVLSVARRRSQLLHTLAAETQWLWDILSSIGDAIIVTDEKGTVQFLNPVAEQLTGWTLAEAQGHPLEEIFPIFNEETRQPVENPLHRVLREGTIVGLANHTVLRRRTGEEISIDNSGTPIRDRSGQLRGAVIVFRDVTELRTLQRRNQHALALRQRLLEVPHSLLELRSPDELLSSAVAALGSLLPLELACFYLLREDRLVPQWHTISSPELAPLVSSPIPLEQSIVGSILRHGMPEVVNNAHEDPRSYYPEGFTPPRAEHLIGIPMQIGQQRAILTLGRYGTAAFSAEEAEIALLFARFIQVGLLNAQLWESLRSSEAQYRNLLEWLPVPLLIHQQGRIVYANHATAYYLGFESRDALVGMSALDLVAPEDRPTVLERIQALYRGELSIAPLRQTKLLHRDGSLREALVTGTKVTYGDAPAVLTIGIDLTEQLRLQQQRERERTAFQLVAQAALQSQTVSELCTRFLTGACQQLGFAGGSVRLLQGELLTPVAITGPWSPELFPPASLEDESLVAAFVARTRQPIFAPDVTRYPFSEAHRRRLHEAGVGALLSYPILGQQGSVLGVFQLFHPTPVELGEADQRFFGILASALGVAVERLQLQERLRESELRFRMLAENAPIAITRFGLRQGHYLFANREFERQSGYSLEEFEALPDRDLIEMIHPEDRQRIFRFWREWQQAGFPGVQRLDYRIFNRHGELVWLDTYLYAERSPDGSPESIVQIYVDITPLKRAEEALRQALQEDFRRTVCNLHAVVFRLRRHPDGTVFYALREGKLAGEATSAALYERPLEDLPEELRFPAELLERAFAGERVSYEAHHAGRWLLYTLEPVLTGTEVVEVVGTGVDISDRKQLELSLAESEERYRSLLETLPVGVLELFISDEETERFLYVNPAFTAITGYTQEELRTLPPYALIHPDDREHVAERVRQWFRSPTSSPLHLEYRCVRKNGEPYWLELYAIKVRQHDGWRLIEVGSDVTERKQAEERIRYLANFPELSPISILEFTADGQLTYANPTARSLLPIAELSPLHPWLAEVWERLPELQRSPEKPWVREAHWGDQVWLQHIFWLPTYQRLRIYAPEITTQYLLRRQLEEALEHEQELAVARSRLMSTIAHEFRTPLAGIQLSVELLQNYFERLSPAERRQELANIAARIQDLNTLVTDFLTQSSLDALRRSLSFQPVVLQDICREAAERIQPLLQSKAQTLSLELPTKPVLIRGDVKALRFVLLNLLTNASKYSGMHQPIHLRLRRELGIALVEVEDHGIGIPEEELPRLFEPFFRGSNAQGIPGVGLGLNLVKEFVELHRGSVVLRSRPQVGTTVTLSFPLVEEA
jgi:PAS domain S-box-containing protein